MAKCLMETSRWMIFLHRSSNIWRLPWRLSPIETSATVSYFWLFKRLTSQNIRAELLTLLELRNIDIFFLSETWLNPLFDDDFCSFIGILCVLTTADRIHGSHDSVFTLCRRSSEVFIDRDYHFSVAATLQNFQNSGALNSFHLPATRSYMVPFDILSSCSEDVVR